MISGGYTTYTLNNTAATGVTAGALTQYFNYVATDTGTSYTGSGGTALQPCTATLICLKLHNGAILQYDTGSSFGGSGAANGIVINVDPDGNGTQGRASFIQFYSGRFTTVGANGGAPTASGATLTNQTTDPAYIANWN